MYKRQSEAFQKHIFEAFSREESSTVSGIQGTGLGMSITKNIVDMMGGTIAIKSEPGKGSEFIVDLCFALSGQRVEPKQLPQLEGLRALVADDDTDTCLSVSTMLSKICLLYTSNPRAHTAKFTPTVRRSWMPLPASSPVSYTHLLPPSFCTRASMRSITHSSFKFRDATSGAGS